MGKTYMQCAVGKSQFKKTAFYVIPSIRHYRKSNTRGPIKILVNIQGLGGKAK